MEVSMEKVYPYWSLQLHGTNFFVTGSAQMRYALDLNYIPGKGVNLSGDGQTLQESYSTAKQVFEHAEPGKIKFVLIEVKPYKKIDDADGFKFLSDDEIKDFAQTLTDYCKLCFDNGARPVIVIFPAEPTLKKHLSANVLEKFYSSIRKAGKNHKYVFINLINLGRFDKFLYGESSLKSNGAAIFTALFSSMLYLNKVVSVKTIYKLPADYFSLLSENLKDDYKNLIQYVFCRTACDDFKRLSETMPKDELKDLMARVFSDMNYNHLANLSDMLSKDDYNDIAARVFKISAEKIRRKDKIKVGFVLYDSSMWSGDDLYHLFERDERFEVTVFLSQRFEGKSNEVVHKDFLKSAELLKSHGLNVVAMKSLWKTLPPQDVLIFLTPYFRRLPHCINPTNLPVSTLMAHLIYSFAVSVRTKEYYRSPIFRIAWKVFFPSTINLKMYDEHNPVGMPRGLYSGYPRLDVFFDKNQDFKFDWKMTRPDAKKIIWAPHHSINAVTRWATFQWNYKFMYEFAKAHPEISWVVKPHPNLAFRVLQSKVFPTDKAFDEYMQKWNNLPNAQVYTGAYFQSIFATSDGIIHDCGSFTAEYQYVDKPMIYLTREGTVFNELGNEIFKGSYLVDGKDFDAIAAMIQRVFIDGDDYKAAERREIFDKYLNYPKANGMLASEFIYKSIADDLTAK